MVRGSHRLSSHRFGDILVSVYTNALKLQQIGWGDYVDGHSQVSAETFGL